MTTYITVILSDQPIAQREGMRGIIETAAVDLPDDTYERAGLIDTIAAELAEAARGRLG